MDVEGPVFQVAGIKRYVGNEREAPRSAVQMFTRLVQVVALECGRDIELKRDSIVLGLSALQIIISIDMLMHTCY